MSSVLGLGRNWDATGPVLVIDGKLFRWSRLVVENQSGVG